MTRICSLVMVAPLFVGAKGCGATPHPFARLRSRVQSGHGGTRLTVGFHSLYKPAGALSAPGGP